MLPFSKDSFKGMTPADWEALDKAEDEEEAVYQKDLENRVKLAVEAFEKKFNYTPPMLENIEPNSSLMEEYLGEIEDALETGKDGWLKIQHGF